MASPLSTEDRRITCRSAAVRETGRKQKKCSKFQVSQVGVARTAIDVRMHANTPTHVIVFESCDTLIHLKIEILKGHSSLHCCAYSSYDMPRGAVSKRLEKYVFARMELFNVHRDRAASYDISSAPYRSRGDAIYTKCFQYSLLVLLLLCT